MTITNKDKRILNFIEEWESITINQCAQMFYPPKFGYDYARQKLKKLKDREVLKMMHDPILDEHVYYIDKIPSPHNNALLNFYTNCIAFKLSIMSFEKEKSFLGKSIRSDGFCIWEGQYGAQIGIIEVDLYHNTNIGKYEKLYQDGELQKQYGDFPYLIILSLTPRHISSKNITIISMNLKCSDFIEKVLPL